MQMSSLERLIASWRASADLHEFRQGATESEIEDFEILAGWKLPSEWRELYLFADGVSLFQQSVNFYPLRRLLDESESLRDSDWPVPEELCVAGGNGEGDKFGLWLPAATADTGPVVCIGPNFVDYGLDGLTIEGSSLSAFLLGKTAFNLLGDADTPRAALAALDIPPQVRSKFPDDLGSWANWWDVDGQAWRAVSEWADPKCPCADEPHDARAVNEALGTG
jgi:SMI1/KNR4 family protein SUKH-1